MTTEFETRGQGLKRFWSQKEDELLRARYPHERTDALARSLKRKVGMVYRRAATLGLKKSQAYLDSPDAGRLRRDGGAGVEYRFPKGNVPANKGLRRPGWAPGRMKETQFKLGARKGKAAENWKPVGTIRSDADGYLRIKVREWRRGDNFGFGNVNIWPLLHRHNWKQANRDIPKGHILIFRNGDRNDCSIENLELITFAENMRRNSVHRLPKEIAQVIQLVGAINRQTRKREKQNVRFTQPSL